MNWQWQGDGGWVEYGPVEAGLLEASWQGGQGAADHLIIPLASGHIVRRCHPALPLPSTEADISEGVLL